MSRWLSRSILQSLGGAQASGECELRLQQVNDEDLDVFAVEDAA